VFGHQRVAVKLRCKKAIVNLWLVMGLYYNPLRVSWRRIAAAGKALRDELRETLRKHEFERGKAAAEQEIRGLSA
jgi:hypothetical protein